VGRELAEPELTAVGETLGKSLPPGAVVWLEGELGAGKTTLAQAIARGLGVASRATSPSYTLVQRYPGLRGAVYHVDCFRLAQPDDAHDLDWESLQAGDALLIEWPERAGAWAPPPTCRVRLEHVSDPVKRRLEVVGREWCVVGGEW